MDNKCTQVLNALPVDNSPIRYNNLLKKIHNSDDNSKMSNSTLVRCLKKLEFFGFVNSKRVKSQKGKGVEYSRNSDIEFFKLDKNIEANRNGMIEYLNKGKIENFTGYDDSQFIHLHIHLQILIKSLLQEFYLFSNSNDIRKSQSRFDLFLSTCIIPYINEILELVKPPLNLKNHTYHRIENVFSKHPDLYDNPRHSWILNDKQYRRDLRKKIVKNYHIIKLNRFFSLDEYPTLPPYVKHTISTCNDLLEYEKIRDTPFIFNEKLESPILKSKACK